MAGIEEGLVVRFSGDDTGLKQSVQATIDSLQGLGDMSVRTAAQFDKSAISQVKFVGVLKNTDGQTRKTASNLGDLAGSADSTSGAMNKLGTTAQLINKAISGSGFTDIAQSMGVLGDRAKETGLKIIILEDVLDGLQTTLSATTDSKAIEDLGVAIDEVKAKIASLNAQPIKVPVAPEATNIAAPYGAQQLQTTLSGISGGSLKTAADDANLFGQAISGSGAKVTVLDKTLGELETDLQGLRIALRGATTQEGFDKIQKDISAAEGKIKSLTATSGSGFDHVEKGSYAARFAVIDLSHSIRDLPYAINNPALLAGPFDRMSQALIQAKQESGSFKGALAAMGAQLSGGGGLLLAISVVSSAVAILGPKLFAAGEDAKSAADKVKEAKDALEAYKASLDVVPQANLTGTQNADEEITKLRLVYAATQNTTLAMGDRRKAVDDLQKEYPKYFGNLSDEIILNGQAKGAYEKLTDAILASAKARAVMESMVEVDKQLLVVEEQIADAHRKFNDSYATMNKEADRALNINIKSRGSEAQAVINQERLRSATDGVSKSQDALNKLLDQKFELQRKIQALSANVDVPALIDDPKVKPLKVPKLPKDKIDFYDAVFDFDPDKANLKPEQITRLVDAARKYAEKNTKVFIGLDAIIGAPDENKALIAARAWWADYLKGVIKFKPNAFLKADVTLVPAIHPGKSAEQLVQQYLDGLKNEFDKEGSDSKISAVDLIRTEITQEQLDRAKQAGKAIADAASGSMSEKFRSGVHNLLGEQLASELADALKGNSGLDANKFTADRTIKYTVEAIGLDAVASGIDTLFQKIANGENVFQSLGDVAGQVLKQVAIQVAELAAFAGVLSLLSGGAAGGGLSLISEIIKLIPGHATGGIVPQGFSDDTYLARLSTNEAIIPLDKIGKYVNMNGGSSAVQVYGKIRGADIILSNARTSRQQRRTG